MQNRLRIALASLLILFAGISYGQEKPNNPVAPLSKKEAKRQKKIQKQLAKDREKVAKQNKQRESHEYKRARERHENIQSDDTRKRMKRRKKNAGSNYGNRKVSLWDRLFGKKHKKKTRKRK